MNFEDAIDLGEYDPKYLSTYPQWHTFSSHVQFQHIRKALDNRHRQLVTQWAEIVNMLDFSKKPELAEALKNIELAIKKLDADREKLYLQYSSAK